jgi:hypothetical protein
MAREFGSSMRQESLLLCPAVRPPAALTVGIRKPFAFTDAPAPCIPLSRGECMKPLQASSDNSDISGHVLVVYHTCATAAVLAQQPQVCWPVPTGNPSMQHTLHCASSNSLMGPLLRLSQLTLHSSCMA